MVTILTAILGKIIYDEIKDQKAARKAKAEQRRSQEFYSSSNAQIMSYQRISHELNPEQITYDEPPTPTRTSATFSPTSATFPQTNAPWSPTSSMGSFESPIEGRFEMDAHGPPPAYDKELPMIPPLRVNVRGSQVPWSPDDVRARVEELGVEERRSQERDKVFELE